MRDQADDILDSFNWVLLQLKHYHTVKRKFDKLFVVLRKVIFERAKFDQRRQEEGKIVDIFIAALHTLAEHWTTLNFGALTDEMTRDRIVVGLDLDEKRHKR